MVINSKAHPASEATNGIIIHQSKEYMLALDILTWLLPYTLTL